MWETAEALEVSFGRWKGPGQRTKIAVLNIAARFAFRLDNIMA